MDVGGCGADIGVGGEAETTYRVSCWQIYEVRGELGQVLRSKD